MAKAQNGLFRTKLEPQQKEVVNFLRSNEVSIIIGAPGTGKDFNCLYRGIDALDTNEHSELILTKPVLELGTKMGYLPGMESDKTEPYEKSFHDNIIKMIGKDNYRKLRNSIKFEAINFMRGNTYEYSTVILSEAQNCTLHELISIVTRVGKSSKLFINGDPNQSDIGHKSGLMKFINIVKDVEGVGLMELGDEHQMRNPMIVEINKKYTEYLKAKNVQTQNDLRAV